MTVIVFPLAFDRITFIFDILEKFKLANIWFHGGTKTFAPAHNALGFILSKV